MPALIDLTFIHPIHGPQHVQVYMPSGNGGTSYSVLINNYFQGQIVKYTTGWQSFVHSEVLMQDDIDAIMDIIIAADN